MKIELKNIKINQSFSEETLCYMANVYINGKKAGTVKNDGHGGCSHVSPDYNNLEEGRKLIAQADEYFKAQPAKDVRYGEREDDVLKDFKETLDTYLDTLVNDYSNAKEAAKFAKRELKIKDSNTKAGYPITFKITKGLTSHYVGVRSADGQVAKLAAEYKVDSSKVTIL